MNEVKYVVTCSAGHSYDIEDLTHGPEVIAAISHCILEVSKPEHGGLVLACGERIVLIRSPKVRSKRGLDKVKVKH